MPLSPLQAAQTSNAESQIGVAPEQLLALDAVHSSHSPAPACPAGSQTLLRQTPEGPAAFVVEHGPLPFGCPQTLSAPQTPLKHRSDAPETHVPLAQGIAKPVAACAWQVLEAVSQYCCAAQSPSTLHPPAGRHTPFAEQAPLWQTDVFVALQWPLPFTYPHVLFEVSQTPLAQTAVPTGRLQTPVSGGV